MASSSQIPQSQHTPSSPPRIPETNFNNLPLELRHKIWRMTLTPRILCLHIQRRYAPPLGSEHLPPSKCHVLDMTAVSFTCTVLAPPRSGSGSGSGKQKENVEESMMPGEVFLGFEKKLREKGKKGKKRVSNQRVDLKDPGTLAAGSCSGTPVVLWVCSESRNIVLKEGYELAFAGQEIGLCGGIEGGMRVRDLEEWNKRGLGEKRIWIEWKRDIILVSTMKDTTSMFYSEGLFPLRWLRRYAPEEIGKIQRLGIGGRYATYGTYDGDFDEISEALKGGELGILERERSGLRYEWLLGFEGLRELMIDDSFGTRKGEMKRGIRMYVPGKKELTVEKVEKEVGEGMKRWKGVRGWEVKVVRWDEWREFC